MNSDFSGDTTLSESATSTNPSRLRTLRKAANLTQRELAAMIGQHHSNVGFWESSGKLPPAELLPAITQALGVSIEELLGMNKKKNTSPIRGKVHLAFAAVSQLPRKQQEKILNVVDALISDYAKKKTLLFIHSLKK